MLTSALVFLGNYTGSIVIGMLLGGVLWLFIRFGGNMSAMKRGLTIRVMLALLVVYAVVQFCLSKLFAPTNFWGLFMVCYAMLAAFLIPGAIWSGYARLVTPRVAALREAAKRRAPRPRTRLIIVLVGCFFAAIGYILPWSQIHSFGATSHLIINRGVDLDGNPPYYISIFNLGNYPYAFLFTLVALPLTNLFVFLRGRSSVFVQVFGRSLHAIQILLLLVAVFFVNLFSIGGTAPALLGGFWITVAGLVVVFIGTSWPYAKTSKPSKTEVFALSVVFLILTVVVIHFGGASIFIALAKALGGGGVAIFLASFLYDLLGPALFSAGVAVVWSGIDAYQSEA